MTYTDMKKQYELEKELARRILNSKSDERAEVIKECYQVWFNECLGKSYIANHESQTKKHRYQLAVFKRFVNENKDVCEIGCGAGNLITALSINNLNCVGIDANDPEIRNDKVTFIKSSDILIPLSDNSFDVVFSDQFLEHLHPEDVTIHLNEVYRILRPNGRYIVRTPNKISGPHDISKYFDDVASCLHLKEWTYSELSCLLEKSGFAIFETLLLPPSIASRMGIDKINPVMSVHWKSILENILIYIRIKKLRRFLCKIFDVYNVTICAHKQ